VLDEKNPDSVLADRKKSPKPEKKKLSTGTKIAIGAGICCCFFITIVIIGLIILAVFSGKRTMDTIQNTQKIIQEDEYSNWQTYKNDRFNFEVKIPDEFVIQESVNGDGASFTKPSPSVSINVFGINASSQNLSFYLDSERENLFEGAEDGLEIESSDTFLGDENAQKRIWEYKNPIDGSETYKVRITAFKNNTFYTIEMIVGKLDYDNYVDTLEKIRKSFKFL
jgi:L-rhamnose mutarotase